MEAILRAGLTLLGLDVNCIPALEEFSHLLLEKNKVMNLTAITEPSAVATLHLLDSLCLLQAADLTEKQVIDVGTGTGILAIAAGKVGASDVLATDLDAMAVRVARENADLNDMHDVIRTREGDLLEAVDEVADVAIANIIADVIVMMSAPIMKHIRPGGIFICSGIARERQDEVIDALNAAGYQKLDVRNQGEWTAIASVRP